MNCRKVSGLLSAYLDQELTGEEMLAVRAHLGDCPLCRSEHQSLSDTKRLLASLALQTPRADLEQLLLSDADRASRPWTSRLVPEFVREWISFQRVAGADPFPEPRQQPATTGRLRPLAATALLSLAGLCLATAKLSGTHEESPQGFASADIFPGYASFTVVVPANAVSAPMRMQQAPLPAAFVRPAAPPVYDAWSRHAAGPLTPAEAALVAPQRMSPGAAAVGVIASPYSYGNYPSGAGYGGTTASSVAGSVYHTLRY